MATDLWAALLDRPLTSRETDYLLEKLPLERRERLLRQAGKQREPLCAYWLLRRALYEKCGWPELPEIGYTSTGKPYFPTCPEIHFNLSHTDGAVLVGLSDQMVGVDIEKIRSLRPSTLRRLKIGSSAQDFFQNWVRLEARSKRDGQGIASIMRSEPPLQSGESYWEIDLFPGYAAGVASGDPLPPDSVRKYTLDQLLSKDPWESY